MTKKLVIFGTGAVGTSAAYSAMIQRVADQIILVSRTPNRAVGEALDLSHGAYFGPPVEIRGGTYSDAADADVIVIATGDKTRPNQNRLELAECNVVTFSNILNRILPLPERTIVIVVTNPCDVLTTIATKNFGIPPQRVLGVGTALDSARLSYLIGKIFRLDAAQIHAPVIGEHGNSQVSVLSQVRIAGLSPEAFPEWPAYSKQMDDVRDLTRHSSTILKMLKGGTNTGISEATMAIIRTVLSDRPRLFCVSTLLDGQYGCADIAMSLPCVLNSKGRSKIITPELSKLEHEQFLRSELAIRGALNKLRLAA
jgi:L-lactate dehydrogenase